jgi:hypothetical protein
LLAGGSGFALGTGFTLGTGFAGGTERERREFAGGEDEDEGKGRKGGSFKDGFHGFSSIIEDKYGVCKRLSGGFIVFREEFAKRGLTKPNSAT